MNLAVLFRAVSDVAQTGGTPGECEALAREAMNLTDMVGWASGPIDPAGEWLGRLATLQDDLQHRYSQSGDAAIVGLNDSLARLGRAIAQHDDDLDITGTGDDEGEDPD